MRPLFLTSLVSLLILSPSISSALQVMGHRGARGEFSENTIPGFLHALNIGVDSLEMDVRMSSQGELIVVHNEKIPKEACHFSPKTPQAIRQRKSHRIDSFTAQELTYLQCDKKLKKFPLQKTLSSATLSSLRLTLKTILAAPGGDKVRFSIEMKPNGLPIPIKFGLSPKAEPFAKKLWDIISEFQLQDRVHIDSFVPDYLKALKAMAPNVKLTFSLLPIVGFFQYFFATYNEDKVFFHRIHLMSKGLSDFMVQAVIHKAHDLGQEVFINDRQQKAEWQHYLTLGVDGFCTDYPSQLLNFRLKNKH